MRIEYYRPEQDISLSWQRVPVGGRCGVRVEGGLWTCYGERNPTAEGQEFWQLAESEGKVTRESSPLENQGSSSPLKTQDTPCLSLFPPSLLLPIRYSPMYWSLSTSLKPFLFLALLSPSAIPRIHISESPQFHILLFLKWDVLSMTFALVTDRNNHPTGPHYDTVHAYTSKISNCWASFQWRAQALESDKPTLNPGSCCCWLCTPGKVT